MLLRRHSDSSDYGDGDRDNGLGDGVDDDGQRRPPPTHTVVDVLLFSQLSFMNHTGGLALQPHASPHGRVPHRRWAHCTRADSTLLRMSHGEVSRKGCALQLRDSSFGYFRRSDDADARQREGLGTALPAPSPLICRAHRTRQGRHRNDYGQPTHPQPRPICSITSRRIGQRANTSPTPSASPSPSAMPSPASSMRC